MKEKHKKKYVALVKDVLVDKASSTFTGTIAEPFAEGTRLNLKKGGVVNAKYVSEHTVGDSINAIESLYQNYQVDGEISYAE